MNAAQLPVVWLTDFSRSRAQSYTSAERASPGPLEQIPLILKRTLRGGDSLNIPAH
jgi:hypothetical protein